MVTTRIAEHVTGTASYKMPAFLSREIGRIIVHWAYFEQCVQEMNWQALKITPAAGRIAVRDPRVTDRLDMLLDIIKERGGALDNELHKSIRARAELIATKRHLLVHGLWFYHKARDEWHVQLTRGSWPRNEAELVSGSKKVTPESRVLTLDELRSATTEICVLIDDLKKLRASATDAPLSSPETLR